MKVKSFPGLIQSYSYNVEKQELLVLCSGVSREDALAILKGAVGVSEDPATKPAADAPTPLVKAAEAEEPAKAEKPAKPAKAEKAEKPAKKEAWAPSPIVKEPPIEKAVEIIKAEAKEAEIVDDDLFIGEKKTMEDCKALLISWAGTDSERKKSVMRRFGDITGLTSLKEVNDGNASSVYVKLAEALN